MELKRILVVDSDQASRELLSEVLEGDGYEVQAAVGAEGVWKFLDENRDGIILIDPRMPGEDGLELLRALKQRSGRCEAVVMGSGISSAERAVAQELGVRGLLEKPFKISELLRVMGEVTGDAAIEI